MTFAAIGDHGEYILPSMDSIYQAVNSSMQVQNVTNINRTASLDAPFMNASMMQNGSYPLTGLYYASWPDNTSNDTRNATLDFVSWMITEDTGQQTLAEVQYPAIYQENEPLTAHAGAMINRTTSEDSKT
jgi:ABC-type phosphate transport system substrate-binding protein